MSTSPDHPRTPGNREVELVVWEADLNRREAALRRAEESHSGEDELARRLEWAERNERELEEMLATVQAQRERLESVRIQYEERCAALAEQTREVAAEREQLQAERDRLRDERVQLVQASIEAERVSARRPEPALAPVLAAVHSDADPDVRWWSLQLGFPLTGARARRVARHEPNARAALH